MHMRLVFWILLLWVTLLCADTTFTIILPTYIGHLPFALATLAAAYKTIDAELVHEYIIICPLQEAAVLRPLLRAPTESTRVKVLSDAQVLGLTEYEMHNIKVSKYRIQMAVKLHVSRLIKTDFYLVLDGDVIVMRPLNSSVLDWLFPEPGKTVYQFAKRSAFPRWWNESELALDAKGCVSASLETVVSGVTPAFLSTHVVRQLVDRWNLLHGGTHQNGSTSSGVVQMISVNGPGFSEYTLYHLMACLLGGYDRFHAVPRKGNPAMYSGVWTKEYLLQKNLTQWMCKDCLFMVIQDHIGVIWNDYVSLIPSLNKR